MELFLCVKTSGKKSSETEKEKEKEGGSKEGVSGRHKASLWLLVAFSAFFLKIVLWAIPKATQLILVPRPYGGSSLMETLLGPKLSFA